MAEHIHPLMGSHTGFSTFTKEPSFPKREADGTGGRREEQKLQKRCFSWRKWRMCLSEVLRAGRPQLRLSAGRPRSEARREEKQLPRGHRAGSWPSGPPSHPVLPDLPLPLFFKPRPPTFTAQGAGERAKGIPTQTQPIPGFEDHSSLPPPPTSPRPANLTSTFSSPATPNPHLI